jgi:hypothetical protein
MLWICLVCLACFDAKCLLQASRVPHPAVGCRSAGRIRQTLVLDSIHHRLCELVVIDDLGGI